MIETFATPHARMARIAHTMERSMERMKIMEMIFGIIIIIIIIIIMEMQKEETKFDSCGI